MEGVTCLKSRAKLIGESCGGLDVFACDWRDGNRIAL